jgi:hypothetical protein
MAWRDVHERILAEHVVLRGMLASLEALVDRFEDGDAVGVETLRDEARALYLRFEAHLSFEDRALLPELSRARGTSAGEALVREHAEQRELLDYLLRRLALPGRPALLLVRELRQFGALLREDMAEEERHLAEAAGSSCSG